MPDCSCGNPTYGFDCVCEWVEHNPGGKEYSCEYCGLYTASKPRCNKCEEETEYSFNEENESAQGI